MIKPHHYTILASRWYSTISTHLGVVAVETETHKEPTERTWKAYLGVCRGFDEEGDMQYIAAWGAPLEEQEARGFFPDITRKYKGST